MPQIRDFGVRKSALHEADVLLGEYEELMVEIKNLKKKALELYAEVEKSESKTGVARTLKKILEIPE